MTLRLNGSTSGYTEIDAPAVAGSNTLVLPGGNGSNGNILGTDGAGNLSWVNGRMVLETAQATTSGTSVDFTGIPSWVKRVTVMFDGVSTNGTSLVIVQLGDSGGVETTGYFSTASNQTDVTSATAGILFCDGSTIVAAALYSGALSFSNVSGNAWVAFGCGVRQTTNCGSIAGSKTLSDTLTQIRITTVNGTDTFDAGSINILYEG
jgi:hypothetical protein